MKIIALSFLLSLSFGGLAHSSGGGVGDLPMFPADKEGRVMAYEVSEPDAKALYDLLDLPEQARDVGFFKEGQNLQCDRSRDQVPRYKCYFLLGFKPEKALLTGSAEKAPH